MEIKIKKAFKKYGAVSISYLQRKYKLNFEYAKNLLETVEIKNSKKIYSNNILTRLIKT